MLHIGAALFVMGLTQLSYQTWLWLDRGVWHALSIKTLLGQLGWGNPAMSLGVLRTPAEALLSVEFSVALTALGAYLVLAQPLGAVVREFNLQRKIRETRREIRAGRSSAA